MERVFPKTVQIKLYVKLKQAESHESTLVIYQISKNNLA